jgi:XTP/dITP diphosphohydrolase
LLTVLVTSTRVAPGLLTWEAWSALRSAPVVAGPAGHPQLPALLAAGVAVTIRSEPPVDGVWLLSPGDDVPPDSLVLVGSADLPGAHLLDLVATMERLRTECPWDAKQTHQSLAPHLLEEPYEALEALESGDMAAFGEELGDVLLQVVFHARIATDFDIDDVADQIVDKLVRRHPHVFGDVTVADAEEVKRNWDAIKKQERSVKSVVPDAGVDFSSTLDGVPFGQPALALATQLRRRAVRAGIPDSVEADFSVGDEIGTQLFRLVIAASEAGLDPESELRSAARRYRDLVREWERTAS